MLAIKRHLNNIKHLSLQPGAPEAVWDWGANVPGGSPSRGSDVMRKNVRKGGGQSKKNLHHHQSYMLHAGPCGTFFKVEY